MHNYLKEILDNTRKRVDELNIVKPNVENLPKHPSFYNSLNTDSISIIAEIKRASPSLGIIDPNFDYIKTAKKYIEKEVNAMSILTEPSKFLGETQYLQEVSKLSNIPLLRKDFIIDEKQIFESAKIGASAILLIVNILTPYQLESFFSTSKELGLDVLVETHNTKEIELANKINADIIGINNRNLETFEVNIENSLNLKKYINSETKTLKISESGIKTLEDIKLLESVGFDAVLIGEAFMKNLLQI